MIAALLAPTRFVAQQTQPVPDWETAAGVFARTGDASAPGAASRSDVQPLVEALKDQLGLKLKATRAPLQVIVADHIERPSED